MTSQHFHIHSYFLSLKIRSRILANVVVSALASVGSKSVSQCPRSGVWIHLTSSAGEI